MRQQALVNNSGRATFQSVCPQYTLDMDTKTQAWTAGDYWLPAAGHSSAGGA